jgi:hypothetical protein
MTCRLGRRAWRAEEQVTGQGILYGLDRLPGTLAADDVRLPAVEVGTAPLRLNSVPLPVEAWGDARITALRSWLLASCGDYNATLRRGVGQYLDAVVAHIEQHRDSLATDLARFHGLYRAEDWCWSALRPLPRAWWRQDGAWVYAELAFWNGDGVIAMHPRDFGELPLPFRRFWDGETLPVSPFRRAFDQTVISIT